MNGSRRNLIKMSAGVAALATMTHNVSFANGKKGAT